jgi:hypothetical protein
MWFLESEHGVLFTVAAGNEAKPIDHYPAKAASLMRSMIVVGATDDDGNLAVFSSTGPQVNVWAPGCNLPTPEPNILKIHTPNKVSGTSMGKFPVEISSCFGYHLTRYVSIQLRRS